MTAPRISVLIPCFNDGQWLDEAVDSVFAQTFQDFEIIIVDDGSTDPDTVQKLSTYAAPRTRVFRTENHGLPAARNYAAARAAGEMFCALDADDRLAPTWFQKGLATLDADPELAFVSHWLEAFGDQHWVWKPEKCDLVALLAHNTVNGAALVRRYAFETVAGYEESMRDGCEDWDFWLRIVERGLVGTIIPEVLFYYRRRSESMSRSMTDSRGYPRPIATLLQRHAPYYRQYVVELLAAQEQDSVRVRAEIARLERDLITTLEPSLARAREELAAVKVKAQTSDRRAQIVEERNQSVAALLELRSRYDNLAVVNQELAARIDELSSRYQRASAKCEELDAERERLTRELAVLSGECERQSELSDRLSRDIAGLQGEIAGIRGSLSWRSTSFLRRVGGWFMTGDR